MRWDNCDSLPIGALVAHDILESKMAVQGDGRRVEGCASTFIYLSPERQLALSDKAVTRDAARKIRDQETPHDADP
jgi:hypothetical protein